MGKILKSLLICMIIPCLILVGCAENILLTIYYIADDVIIAKQVKAEEFSSASLIAFLKENDVLPEDASIIDFKNEGSDSYRKLSIDFNDVFRDYIISSEPAMQKLILQATANTFIDNYKADAVYFTANGEYIVTYAYDFSEPFEFKEVGTGVNGIIVKTPYIEATPIITPETTPETTPEATPENTPNITPGKTPTTAPTKSPIVTVTPTKKPQNNGEKIVAITFDDGPHSKYTKLLADVCKQYNAGATFFIVGNRVNSTTGPMLKYAQDRGCEIQIHGYTHLAEAYYNKCSDERYMEELTKTAEVIKKYTGKEPTMMRPFGGAITSARISSCPYTVVQWTVDSEDWRHKSTGDNQQEEINIIVNNVMNTVGPGKIILMHELYENSYQAFKIIMEKLYAQGYKVVTVTELMGKENIKPGIEIHGR